MSISTAAGGGVSRNLAIVKQYFKKPMMLVVAVLSLVSVGAEFLFNQSSEKFSEQMADVLKSMVEGMEGVDISASSGNNTFGYLLAFVVTICLFLIFFTSLMPKGGPTVFFSVLHILSVLQLIFTSIIALFVVIGEVVFVLSSSTIVKFLVGNDVAGMGSMTEEQIEAINRGVASFRVTLLIMTLVTIVIFGIYLYYINSQTAFLKSVMLTCKNPMLKSKGAAAYGNISTFIGIIDLVLIVIIYLLIGNPSSSVMGELDYNIDVSPIIKPYLIYSISTAVYIIARGTFAKGWEAYAKENEDSVYEAVGSGNRQSDASPMPTFKSTQRKTHDARQQSQPYLIGEEQDPNKKSSYIPEELQGDNFDQPQDMYGQQGFGNDMYGGGFGGGFGNDPYGQQGGGFGGNPYGQQGGGFIGGNDPYGQGDPFAQSPMGNDPYGQQGGFMGGNDPYGQGGQGYNNGMM